MRKHHKACTPKEKVAIIRKHLLNGVVVSELCDVQQLNPIAYYHRRKELFEAGAAAFSKEYSRQVKQMNRQLAATQV